MRNKTTDKYIYFVMLILSYNANAVKKGTRKIPENYKEEYTSSDYQYQEQEPSFLITFKEWLRELLHNLFKDIGVTKNGVYYTKLIFYIIIAIAAIYIIARMFFYKEGNWLFKKTASKSINYQTEVEEIELANFSKLIKKELDNTNYRLAVKYYYLWILQKFSEKEIIELSNLKTNADYQLEVDTSPYQHQFKDTSYYYNYIWYGEFFIDREAYQKIEPLFKKLLNDIK